MIHGKHNLKFGGEFRMLTLYNDQLGGTTYSFGSVAAFLANTPSSIAFNGDLSAKSPFTGLSGKAHLRQNLLHPVRAGRMQAPSDPDHELRTALRILPAAARRQQQEP